jgi:hypothetical protein
LVYSTPPMAIVDFWQCCLLNIFSYKFEEKYCSMVNLKKKCPDIFPFTPLLLIKCVQMLSTAQVRIVCIHSLYFSLHRPLLLET